MFAHPLRNGFTRNRQPGEQIGRMKRYGFERGGYLVEFVATLAKPLADADKSSERGFSFGNQTRAVFQRVGIGAA